VLNLDLAVILGLLGFITSVTIARFIESSSEGES
jgi:multisubunit Na+/H+ antiporter MnhF subunit